MPHSQETISCALAPTNANLDHEVMVTGIKVSYKKPRKDYPVSIRIIIGDEVTIKSQRYDKTKQEFLWDLNNCPRRFSSDATFTVVVREHHSIQRWDRRVSTTVTVANMIMKPILVIDEPSGEAMSLSIHCETAGPFVDLIHQLVEDAQGRLLEMKPFIEQLGKVCEALNIIVIVSEPLGDAHPGVKAAVKVATLLYEKCNAMQECHAAATELMEDIASFLPFTEIQIERCKSTVTVQTSESLLEVFEQISRAIIDTSPATVLGFLLRDRLDEVNGYKEKLKKLKETFDWCVKTEIWKTVLRIETHTASLFLTRLRPVDSAFYASEKSCFEGTRKATLDIIERWSSSDSDIFWLHGSEGCGKSTIAHTVAQLFDEQKCLAGCFFFDGCGVERRNPEAVIPTIAYQLAKWHKPYFHLIFDLLSGHAERNIHSSLVSQFDLLVRKPLIELSEQSMAKHQPPPHRSLIIVLDALEQSSNSEHSRRFLAGYVRRIAKLVPWLKVFVSSRKLPGFSILSGSDCQEIEISDPLVDCDFDIAAYAKYQASREVLPVETRLAQDYKFPGMHSRIRVLMQMLGAPEIGSVVEAKAVEVEKIGMDELAHLSILAIMSRLGCGEDMVPIILDVLAVAAFVTTTGGKPPTQDMLLQILSPFWPAVTLDALSDVLHSLRWILSFDGSEVELLFPASQFLCLLSDGRRSGAFAVDIDKVGNRVVRRCFDEMDAHLRFVIRRLDSSYLLSKDADNLAALIKMRIPEVLYYSCLNWMDCVIKCGDAQAFSKIVFSFLCCPRILVWLEVLSLTGRLEVSKEILLKCIDFFKAHDDVCEAAKDLHSFILGNDTTIEPSNSHIYVSSLAWPPGDSLLSNCDLRFVSSRLKIVFESSATEEIIERMDSENDFFCIANCTDGSRIVSGHTDGRLNIWDGRTGALIHGPLSGHSGIVWSIAFSRDGSRIASGSDDGLRIWDALTGKLVAPFKTKSTVTAVTFSPDGSRIVSGHMDGTIRIWNALSGDVIVESSELHYIWIKAAAYSPDGNRIVTGSDDNRLRIWDANTAASIGNPLVGHSHWVMAVAYSPDCSKIVSGSRDEIVRIWDAQTGRQLGEPLEGHLILVMDVGFSRDGSKILSSYYNGIRMWDANSGALVGVVPRGESRWDIERQCFVSIPSWWPSGQKLKVQSLLLSANPLYIPNDGWIRTLDGGLLLWVPPGHKWCACHTTQDRTVTKDEHDERILNSEWGKLFHGKDWARILGVEGTEDD